MIPYFEWQFIHFGPFTLHVWGFFTALGFLSAIMLSEWRYVHTARSAASPTRAERNLIWDVGAWIMAGALVGARLGHVFFYEWPYFAAHPIDIIKIWDGGMASYGGFIGAAIAFLICYKIYAFNVRRVADALMWAFPFGMIVGRIGCSFIHDHPGILTDSIFGVQYPGGARFDLGLLELVALIPLAIAFFALRTKQFRAPVFTIVVLLYYGVGRFLLDMLRATDVVGADARYFGLTPAQYGSFVLAAAGAGLMCRYARMRRAHAEH